MALEIGKARKGTIQLQGLVHLSPDGSQSRVLDIRTVEDQIQAKLENAETGDVAWFALEPGDCVQMERRRHSRNGSKPTANLSASKSRALPPDTPLQYPAYLTCIDGTEGEVIAASKNKEAVRLTLADSETGIFQCRLLMAGDVLKIVERPVYENSGIDNHKSLSESLRELMAERMATADAARSGETVSGDTQPQFKILPRRDSFLSNLDPLHPKKLSRMAMLTGIDDVRKLILVVSLFLIPVFCSGYYVYTVYRWYNPEYIPGRITASDGLMGVELHGEQQQTGTLDADGMLVVNTSAKVESNNAPDSVPSQQNETLPAALKTADSHETAISPTP